MCAYYGINGISLCVSSPLREYSSCMNYETPAQIAAVMRLKQQPDWVHF